MILDTNFGFIQLQNVAHIYVSCCESSKGYDVRLTLDALERIITRTEKLYDANFIAAHIQTKLQLAIMSGFESVKLTVLLSSAIDALTKAGVKQ